MHTSYQAVSKPIEIERAEINARYCMLDAAKVAVAELAVSKLLSRSTYREQRDIEHS